MRRIEVVDSDKGIGRTCDIVKLFHLCRFDTFPEGDLGVRNGFRKYYGFDIDSREAEKITTIGLHSEV